MADKDERGGNGDRDGKFWRLREEQDIVLEQADPAVPIVVNKAKKHGHHGIVTKGAKVGYQPKETA